MDDSDSLDDLDAQAGAAERTSRRERRQSRTSRFASDLEDDIALVRTPAQQVDELLARLGLVGGQ